MSPLPRRVRGVIARRSKLEDSAAADQVRILKALRRDILGRLADASGFQLFRLQQMLGVVDTEMRRYRGQAERASIDATQQAWTLGADLARLTIGEEPKLWGISPQLLQSVVDVTADQTRAVWSELGTRLKTEVRRVTLGVTDPFEAMTRTARLIKDPKTFGKAFTRAEAIIRTGVNRTFSMATDERSREGDKRLADVGQRLVKWWISAEDDRVREAHAAAAARYKNDSAIPIDQPFDVGGEQLRYPGDPAGSPWNTINCRCVQLTRVVTLEEFEALAA